MMICAKHLKMDIMTQIRWT